MLPFARMLEYGNVQKPWYTGTEIMAFDSNNYKSTGFTDYVGNVMQTGAYVTNGLVPVLDNKPIFDGRGIKFLYGGYCASSGKNVSTWLGTAWTLDFWICQDVYTPQMQLSFTPIAAYTDFTYTSYTNRFLVAEANNYLYQWNNSFGGTSWDRTYPDLLSTTYVHCAIIYDGTNFKVYTNGVLQQTIVKGAFVLPNPSTSLVLGPLGQAGYQPTKFSTIERYRLRSGVVWNANFNTSDIYPK